MDNNIDTKKNERNADLTGRRTYCYIISYHCSFSRPVFLPPSGFTRLNRYVPMWINGGCFLIAFAHRPSLKEGTFQRLGLRLLVLGDSVATSGSFKHWPILRKGTASRLDRSPLRIGGPVATSGSSLACTSSSSTRES